MIFPGSSQFSSQHRWIIAASFLETGRLYALNVAAIQPEWLEPLARDLCTYSWSEPRYHKKSGQVVANEKVTLFGLLLVPSRKVNFATTTPDNKQEARSIFIQSALVEGDLTGTFSFFHNNQKLLKKWQKIESRLRTRDVLSHDQVFYQFYDNVLPGWVYDRSQLKKYCRNRKNTAILTMTEQDIIKRVPGTNELADFPEHLTIGSHSFQLRYTFDPGSDQDGVTVVIPRDLFTILPPALFEWTVPGFLHEKVTYLLKSLPKKIRKKLVPISSAVDRILDDLILYKGSLYRSIEASISKHYKISIHHKDWVDELPNHLQMRISLIDLSGEEIVSSRSPEMIGKNDAKAATNDKAKIDPKQQDLITKWESRLISHWDFEDLPENIPLFSLNDEIAGYLFPLLQRNKDRATFSFSFTPDKKKAEEETLLGLNQLFRKQYSQQIKSIKKYFTTSLSGPSALWFTQHYSSKSEAVESLIQYCTSTLFDLYYELLFNRKSFEERIASVSQGEIFSKYCSVFDAVMSVLRKRQEVLHEIEKNRKLSLTSSSDTHDLFEEYITCLNEILPHSFTSMYTLTDLENVHRYLKALIIRIQRAQANRAKDQQKSLNIKPYEEKLNEILSRKDELSAECEKMAHEFKIMVWEYRISLFAPEIRTKMVVSPKKLNASWKEIKKTC